MCTNLCTEFDPFTSFHNSFMSYSIVANPNGSYLQTAIAVYTSTVNSCCKMIIALFFHQATFGI